MGKTLAVRDAPEASKASLSPPLMAFRNAGGHLIRRSVKFPTVCSASLVLQFSERQKSE